MQTYPYRAGQILASDDVVDGVHEYLPVLQATGTNPFLGSGSVQEGRWVRTLDGWITAWARIRFGTSGVSSGSGTYLITLPTPVSSVMTAGLVGLGNVVGEGSIRDELPVSAFRGVRASIQSLTAGPGGVGRVQLAQPASGAVTSASPWTWSTQDALAIVVDYIGVV
ncbi:hypothetical protein [Phytoactinopolyspora limicola]|uniref:hypothetical protein n=1 Tax=Phytoactinopolyspora limicola TaxID=2715536 RepID=UPI00140C8B94|nr:hypothetical protein [Phytoactinopolyspora limicola]